MDLKRWFGYRKGSRGHYGRINTLTKAEILFELLVVVVVFVLV
jgi:hypothetical protein